MLSIIPIDKCQSPVRLRSYDGTYSLYPCGKCSHCLHNRQSRWRRKLNFELSTEGVYALFITLTYSNEHLPLLEYDDNKKFIKFTRTKFNRHGKFYRVDETEKFRKVYPEFESCYNGSDWNYPHFTASRVGDKCISDSRPLFAISYLPDIQDFVKRLRTNLRRSDELQTENVDFKYFICSEYGPKTYRPHYHGILFFRSEKVRKHAYDGLVLKSWNKCASDSNQASKTCEYITKNDGIASYVSKYITSPSDLPVCFSSRFTRSFYTFSKSNPIGSEFLPLLNAKELVEAGDVLFHTSFHDKQQNSFIPVDYPYSDSFWNRIFPRFSFQSRLSPDLFFEVFKHLYHYATKLPRTSDPFGPLPDLSGYDIPNYVQYVKEKYFINPKPRDYSGPLSDYDFSTYSSVLRSLLCEPNFLDLFAFGIPQNRSASIKIIRNFRTSLFGSFSDYYVSYIRFFYLKFKTQYEQFVEYASVYSQEEFMSPHMVLFLYPSLREDLCDEYDCLPPEKRDKYNRILQIGFDLTIEDFYVDGHLIEPYFDNFAWSQYSDFVKHKNLKHKSTRKYNFNKFEDL